MEPIFIYYNDLKFEDNKIFNVEFSNEDRLQGVMFLKKKGYYLTSMSCFIKLSNDLSELSQFEDIKKISELSNEILKRGVDYSYKEKELEVSFGNDVKTELEPTKKTRPSSVETVEFFDHVTKQKRFVLIYSPYKELKGFGLEFNKKDDKSYVNKYTIKMKEKNDKLYLEKELFFDERKILDHLAKEKKNIFFLKYSKKIHPLKLEIVKAYYKKLKDKNTDTFQKFLNKTLFPVVLDRGIPIPIKTYPYLIERKKGYMSKRWPIIINQKTCIIKEDVELYITPEMYAKNKSFFKEIPETDEVNVTSAMLTDFRTRLRNPNLNI